MSSVLDRVVSVLISPRLATLLIVAWASLVVVWIIPFEFYGLPATQLQTIVYREPFFRGLYLALALTTMSCLAVRMPALFRALARRRPEPGAAPRASAHDVVFDQEWDADRAVAALRAVGFRDVVIGDEPWVWAIRRRASAAGTLMLHVAIILLMVAGLVVVFGGREFLGEAVVARGETFDSKTAQWASLEPAVGERPDLRFTVVEVEPRFHEDLLLFTKLAVTVRDAAGRLHPLTLASPWISSPEELVAIKDFGYALDVGGVAAGKPIDEKTYKLKVFPSTMVDTFDVAVPPSTYRVRVRVLGDYVDRAGVPGVKSFNLDNPRLLVGVSEVLTSKAEVERLPERLVSLDETVAVPGGSFVVRDIRYYGVFRITRRPEAPYIFAAALLGLLGVCLRLVFPRQQVLLREVPNGIAVSLLDGTYGRDRVLVRRLEIAMGGDR